MLGIDLVAIARIKRLVEKYDRVFLQKFLNDSEIALAQTSNGYKIHTIAGFFATKEALSKALGSGIGSKVGFLDITISKNDSGAPQINLAQKVIDEFGIYGDIELSISHDSDYAIAVVRVERDSKK